MKTASTEKLVGSTLDSIRQRDPAYTELADRFGPLFLAKGKVRDTLVAGQLPEPDIDATRLAAGVPVLADVDLSTWTEALETSRDKLLPEVFAALQLDAATAETVREHLADSANLVGLAQARIEGDLKRFENTSVQLGIEQAPLLLYISETVFGPVLCAMVHGMGKSLSEISWDKGNCPVCGSSPSIAQLAPPESQGSEYLVGGGGKKYLHCSLCGHDWHFKRNACAGCGNVDDDTREILHQEGKKYERIEICNKCGKYMLVVDMREFDPKPHLDVVQMGLVHLDILARERQLSPVSATLWNTLE